MSEPLHLLALALAASWRIVFLTVSAPVIGAVLLLAIARLTGADWRPLDPLAALVPILVPAGVLIGLCALANPAPDHLVIWMSWWGVGLRALVVTLALAFASVRLRRSVDVTFAAIVLTVYAVLVTPVASDWMLGQAPGHSVSAIGMMQLTESLAGATALALAARMGSDAFRSDMARLMVAAVLGLGYLVYMDYLIIWFGNLPSHVGFYVERSTLPMGALVPGALAAGIVVPILLLWLGRDAWSQRLAGLSVSVSLFLFNVWWVAGGVVALLLALVLTVIAAAAAWRYALVGESHV